MKYKGCLSIGKNTIKYEKMWGRFCASIEKLDLFY